MADDFRPRENDQMVQSEPGDYDVPPVRGRGGRRIMVGLVAIAAILGFGVAILYAYNKGKQNAQGEVPPVIHAKEGPSKVKPESPGGMNVPNRDKEIFSRLEAGGKPKQTEQLLPPPEKPLAPPKGGEAVIKTQPAMIAPAAGEDTAAKSPELPQPPPPLKRKDIKPPQFAKAAPKKKTGRCDEICFKGDTCINRWTLSGSDFVPAIGNIRSPGLVDDFGAKQGYPGGSLTVDRTNPGCRKGNLLPDAGRKIADTRAGRRRLQKTEATQG